MARHPRNRNPAELPPLDHAALERLALRYVERYATSRAKLLAYLTRKLRERGGQEDATAEAAAAIVERVAELGYVDDRAFAGMRANALVRRGMGARRRREALRAAGIAADDVAETEDATDDAGGWPSALTFARRRRIGPFAQAPADADVRRRQFAAMLRAGHDFEIARALTEAEPGILPPDAEDANLA